MDESPEADLRRRREYDREYDADPHDGRLRRVE